MNERLTDLALQPEIRLAAIDDERNIRRGYTITRSTDLFGWHVVTWAWGRLGAKAQRRICAFPEERAAVAFARRLLARRASALNRLGVPYRQTV